MRKGAFLSLALLAASVFTPALAGAQQYDIPGASGAVSIVMTPSQPSPKSTVRLTLQSPLIDLGESRISWRVNGEPLSEGDGLVSVSINIGNAGESTDVSAAIVSGSDNALAQTTITPAGLDLLWEAEGYVPPFYGGRTLPGVGAKLTFVAYPTFVQDGERVAEKDLIYTWRRGDTVLGSLSGRGRASVTMDAPVLFSSDVISVEARTSDGTISARASVRIPSPDPSLRLYENHPLFGVLYHRALGATTFTSETEMTFVAVPFFAPTSSANDGSLVYEWRVNQTDVAASTKTPSQITINAQGSTGVALIELDLSHRTNFFFGTNATWHVTFSRSGDAVDGDPFRAQ